jgi:hypothetical protein
MSIPATNIATQVYPNRYYIDTSELVGCVYLPVSPFAVDKLTPEGQYRPLKVLMYVNEASPATPANRVPLAYFDKILPGYLIDVTDIVRSFITDPLIPLQLAFGFSVIINVNEVLYEVPTKAAIVKQQSVDPIINVDFVNMAVITDPDPLVFVIETKPFITITYHTTTGILIPDVGASGGVFRLRRVIDPVFSGDVVPPSVDSLLFVGDSNSSTSTSPYDMGIIIGSSPQFLNAFPLDIIITSIVCSPNVSFSFVPPTPLAATCVVGTGFECLVTALSSGAKTITINHNGTNSPFVITAS